MNTYIVYTQKPYEHIIKAESEKTVQDIVSREYPDLIISKIINCSSIEYQMAYDNARFDSEGRRKF